jgi:mono/diheme cytochrome c family protein
MIAAMIIGFATCSFAQGIDVGKTEYQSSCAACHGIDAKGNGPVSKELKTRPADLTVLAQNNNGVFPYDMVYQMIDGRNRTVASHGTREMPIWGYRFAPPQAFRYKKRMRAVIDYLKAIQESDAVSATKVKKMRRSKSLVAVTGEHTSASAVSLCLPLNAFW